MNYGDNQRFKHRTFYFHSCVKFNAFHALAKKAYESNHVETHQCSRFVAFKRVQKKMVSLKSEIRKFESYHASFYYHSSFCRNVISQRQKKVKCCISFLRYLFFALFYKNKI
jgi:hypothetical protein